MRKKIALLSLFFLFSSFLPVQAEPTVPIHVTVIIASNQGQDYDLVNDDFRDQLLQLFSYSAYHQVDELNRDLSKAKPEIVSLPDGYELKLNLQGEEKGRVMVQAAIRKGNQQYVDTTLSILRPGVVFLGGPPAQGGAIILVLETTF